MSLHNETERLIKMMRWPSVGIIGTSSLLSYSCFKVILPGEGWEKEASAIMLTLALFCCMYVLWASQKTIFVQLGTKSKTALFTHIFGVLLILGLSPPSNFIAQVWESASVRDMHSAQKLAETRAAEVASSFHAAAKTANLIVNQANKMQAHANAAERGDLTGVPGRGAAWKTYIGYRDSLNSIAELIRKNVAEADDLIQTMDLALGQMRKATENNLPLGDQVVMFEERYRDFSMLYSELSSMNLNRQIEASLKRLQDAYMAPDAGVQNSKEALRLANRTANKLIGEINEYINNNTIPLQPLPAYKLDSPAIVSFRYLFDYWVQLILSFALDLAPLVVVWMLAAARQYSDDEGISNETFDLKQLTTLADAMQKMMPPPRNEDQK